MRHIATIWTATPELKALIRKDFAAMDETTLLAMYRTNWYHAVAARELRRRGIDPSADHAAGTERTLRSSARSMQRCLSRGWGK